MPTFVESVQSVDPDDVVGVERRLERRIERLGRALDRLEAWTATSRDARSELTSKYETAKSLARTEIEAASDDGDADGLSAEALLDHPAVADRTKDRLREYSTKLYVYLDEEQSYVEARAELIEALTAELDLYERLLSELAAGETSVRSVQRAVAAFARDESPGSAARTAVDVILDAPVDET